MKLANTEGRPATRLELWYLRKSDVSYAKAVLLRGVGEVLLFHLADVLLGLQLAPRQVALKELNKNIKNAPKVVRAAQLQALMALQRRVPAT